MEVIRDPLLRQQLWTSFSDLTGEMKMKSTDYLNLVSTKISTEKDPKLLQTVLNNAMSVLVYFVPKSLDPLYSDKLFYSFFNEYKKATQRDFIEVWTKAIIDFARTEATVKILQELLRNNNWFSQEIRWSIIQKLVAWGLPDAQEFLKIAQQMDTSDDGVRALLTINTCAPDIQLKRAAWARFINPDTKLSAHQSTAEMAGFRWHHQESLLSEFTEQFFEIVPSIFKNREKEFSTSFYECLYPMEIENPRIIELSNHLLEKFRFRR